MLKCPRQLNYRYPLNIPEGKSGKVEITHNSHPKGDTFMVVSMRDAILTGKRPCGIEFDYPIVITALKEDGNIWMTDIPAEQEDAHEALTKCEGHVLVGGLGLGYFVKKLQEKKEVTQVDVIEISSDVIKLVWKHLRLDNRFNIINMDIKQWLTKMAKTKPTYDWIYLDTWRGDGEGEFIYTVLPLKRKIKKSLTIKEGHILSWKEDTMLGQFQSHLQSNVVFRLQEMMDITKARFKKLERSKWFKIYAPFWNKVRTNHLTQAQAQKLIKPYIQWIANGMITKFKGVQ